jgi:hypothetical protein
LDRNGFGAISSLAQASGFMDLTTFQGLVDNALDPHYGYVGPLPKVGDKPAAQRRTAELVNRNEVRDEHRDMRGGRQGSKTCINSTASLC